MAEQPLTAAEICEAIRDMTEAECREALTYLSGWTEEGVAAAIAFILPDRAAAMREECTR